MINPKYVISRVKPNLSNIAYVNHYLLHLLFTSPRAKMGFTFLPFQFPQGCGDAQIGLAKRVAGFQEIEVCQDNHLG